MTKRECPCGLAVHKGTKHLHRPHCPLDTRGREDRIAQAIGDPGSILPRAGRDTDQPESITRWSTRAVLAVLEAETRLPRGLIYLDGAPGGDRNGHGELRCQTRAMNADGATFRCARRAWHPDRPHNFVAEPKHAEEVPA